MGLSQQVAYSSLLAFFPAVAFLLGALGLFGLYDNVKTLLEPIAPSGVITFIDNLQQDTQGSTSAWAFILGFFESMWSGYFQAEYRDVASFLALTFLLIMRPHGLFAPTRIPDQRV